MNIPNQPSPEEIQKRLSSFLSEAMRGHGSGFIAGPEGTGEGTSEATPPPKERFDFSLTPKQIKAHLDRFVIRQDEAKKVLAIAVCEHYHHVRRAIEAKEKQGKLSPNHAKQNILLLGPTGVGKTYLIKLIADLIGVPMVKGDATKFTETGYVGGDVEDLVRDLVQQANGDAEMAGYGIVYIDEIDKLAAAPSSSSGRDVSGRGVQSNLLKMMEETEIPLRSQTDLQGQLQAMMEFQRRGQSQKETINTRNILFIVSGAFDKLPPIIERRINTAAIGFGASSNDHESSDDLLSKATTADFLEYGIEPEFIGRLPVRVACSPLKAEDLFDILKSSEGSLVHQIEESFQAFGIEVLFTDDGLKAIAEQAAGEGTGARGLVTICERILRDFKFELPGTHVRQLVVTKAVVANPQAHLPQLLEQGHSAERRAMGKLVRQFGQRFERDHGLALDFTESAIDKIVTDALSNHRAVKAHCELLFKDFEFGLKLIAKNSGRKQFKIDKDAAARPGEALSEWVIASYGTPAQKERGKS